MREGRCRCNSGRATAAATARCSWCWRGNSGRSRGGRRRPQGCSGRSRIHSCYFQGYSGGRWSRYWCGYRTSSCSGSWYRCSSNRSGNSYCRRPWNTICGCYCQGMHACAVTSTPSLHNGAHVGSERSQPGAHGSSSLSHLTPQASGQVLSCSSAGCGCSSAGCGCSSAGCGCSSAGCGACCSRGAWPRPCRSSSSSSSGGRPGGRWAGGRWPWSSCRDFWPR